MTTENISLFQAMNAKMNYLAQRQKVISQNVANADTPSYIAKDLRKVDFSKMLENIDRGHARISLKTNNPLHQDPVSAAGKIRVEDNRTPYSVKLDGNSVVLEEQMLKSNDVQMQYSMMVNLYRNNADLIRTALGRRN